MYRINGADHTLYIFFRDIFHKRGESGEKLFVVDTGQFPPGFCERKIGDTTVFGRGNLFQISFGLGVLVLILEVTPSLSTSVSHRVSADPAHH